MVHFQPADHCAPPLRIYKFVSSNATERAADLLITDVPFSEWLETSRTYCGAQQDSAFGTRWDAQPMSSFVAA